MNNKNKKPRTYTKESCAIDNEILKKEVNNKRIQTWRLLDDKKYLLKVLDDIEDQTYKDYTSHIEMCHQITLIIESARKRMEISNNYLSK